jgi:hypothetical protein
MRDRQRTFAELLTRSLAVSGFLYALVIAYAVPATLLDEDPAPEAQAPAPSRLSQTFDHPAWTSAAAKRFPRCIDMAEWPGDRPPGDVVVVRHDGRLARMSFDEAFHRATSPSAADDVWMIGACD